MRNTGHLRYIGTFQQLSLDFKIFALFPKMPHEEVICTECVNKHRAIR